MLTSEFDSTASLLRISLQAPVGLHLLTWKANPAAKPDPWAVVPCYECHGEGGGKGGACHTCGGRAGAGQYLPLHQALAMMVATHGDCLMFKVPGVTAQTFNALALGLALMAYAPGGVTFLGDHWEVKDSGEQGGEWVKRLRKVLLSKRLRKVLGDDR